MVQIDRDKLVVHPGRATPLGPEFYPNGVRFNIVSRHTTRVWLALFNDAEDREPVVEIEYDPEHHRVGDVWSIYLEGLPPGAFYMYRMDGPHDPQQGHRYDPAAYLLDPYARVIVGDIEKGTAKCQVFDEDADWYNDTWPKVPLEDLVIYETHVRGMSVHESSGVQHPGSYLGLVEKIPYLKELGVNAVELLPVQEFGQTGLGRCSMVTTQELRNYWGYNTIGFFAPTSLYASQGGRGEQFQEFRTMVTKLHEAGIEIILDVVFNHTAEGDERGRTLCFRGIDNAIYYTLDEEGGYRNFSGCGNTVNCNHPIVRSFIQDCLRYWVTVMHIDGFRFDLASILGRDRKGNIVENPALVERIAEDPVLRDTKLIAEAWDAGGAYQVGSFGDGRWSEWNGRYRDDVRCFWRGDAGTKGAFATRLTGSSDLYYARGHGAAHSINFVTAHDGFTLRDLVSYKRKHNEANGEQNRDGSDHNISVNCGKEGESRSPEINALRLRMQKNFLATLFLSRGIPMLLGGDEFGRTQKGNNNAYCQDNDISWYDWSFVEKNQGLLRFCREVIRFRHENPAIKRAAFYEGKVVDEQGHKDVEWYNPDGKPCEWDEPAPVIACRIDGSENNGTALYLIFNATRRRVKFAIPEGNWVERINTLKASPEDIHGAEGAPEIGASATMTVAGKTLVVLSQCP